MNGKPGCVSAAATAASSSSFFFFFFWMIGQCSPACTPAFSSCISGESPFHMQQQEQQEQDPSLAVRVRLRRSARLWALKARAKERAT
jgi:hypothetical protein